MSASCPKNGSNRAPLIEELPGSLPLRFNSTLLWRGGLLQRTSQL